MIWFFKRKKKPSLKKIYEKIGIYYLVEPSRIGMEFNVPLFKIVRYFKGMKVDEEPFTDEKYEILKEKAPILFTGFTSPFRRFPANKMLLGRLELPRAGLGEEEL